MNRDAIESLMRHDVPPKRRTKAKWPLSVKRPRMDCCGKEPPACRCKEEDS